MILPVYCDDVLMMFIDLVIDVGIISHKGKRRLES